MRLDIYFFPVNRFFKTPRSGSLQGFLPYIFQESFFFGERNY